ncbi:MAG: hypothetical protein H6830_09430 [Planctomycetes bacterium]|nr:hypothetical protein [Planctomycetota bacterium]MCB9909945.1 hypothetical protein [Planctomycetota bacterium]MCB9912918.1 hypothetical protein [Planctomycetota bacterium]HPF13117.1 hypothetical protein [Planctomycetota bacterium]HRV80075.1 hypothetical protein [Planctomycetota bacterium]
MDIRKTNQPKRIQGSDERPSILNPVPKPQSGPVGPSGEVAGGPQSTQEAARGSYRDEIQLSATAQTHAADNLQSDELRANLVEELRLAYQGGSLNTPERLESAARALLGANR